MSQDRPGDPGGAPRDPAAAHPWIYESHHQESFEFALDGRLITDNHGVILQANHAVVALLGCRRDFLIGKPLGSFVAKGHRAAFYQTVVRLLRFSGGLEFETALGFGAVARDVVARVGLIDGGAGGLALLHWFIQDITERRKAMAAQADLLRRLVTAQEDERRRVARELHDSVGQLLSALSLAVRSVRDAEPLSASTLDRIDVVQRVADELGRTMHDLAVRLRPTSLDDFGLKVALQSLITEWAERTGIDADFQSIGLEVARFAPEVETALYRVVQEALTNIAKHADARLVSVVVERRYGDAIVVIEDDGVGFDPEVVARSGRLGLVGMRERIAQVDGALQIEAAAGAGTLIQARIPLRPPNPTGTAAATNPRG